MSEADEGKQSTETTRVPEGVHEAAPEGESLTWTGGQGGGPRPRAGRSPRQERGGCQVGAVELLSGLGRRPGAAWPRWGWRGEEGVRLFGPGARLVEDPRTLSLCLPSFHPHAFGDGATA